MLSATPARAVPELREKYRMARVLSKPGIRPGGAEKKKTPIVRAIGVFFMAALVQGHGYSQLGVPRQMAVLHTREGCDGQSNGVATVVLPRVGLRGDVLHLRELLSGTGLLRGWLPRPDETPTEAARQAATPAKSGRTARSPGPTAGLPGTAPTPRDGSYFRR